MKKIIIAIISIIIISIVGLFFLLFQSIPFLSQPQIIKSTPTPPFSPGISLSLSSEKPSVSQGQQVSVSLVAEGDQPILAIDTYLHYDQNYLKFVDAKPGGYFPQPLIFSKKNDPQSGILFYALGALQQPNTKGALMNYTFTAIKPGSTAVTISPRTLASVKGGVKATISIRQRSVVTIQ